MSAITKTLNYFAIITNSNTSKATDIKSKQKVNDRTIEPIETIPNYEGLLWKADAVPRKLLIKQ